MNETPRSIDHFRNTLPRFHAGGSKKSGVVDLLGEIAKRKNATPAHIALAWLLGKNLDCSNPGTTN